VNHNDRIIHSVIAEEFTFRNFIWLIWLCCSNEITYW